MAAVLAIAIFFSPFGIISVFVALKTYDFSLYSALVDEDGLVEWAQAIFYLMAAGIGIAVVRHPALRKKRLTRILWAIFCVGCTFGFLEEISWGERIFPNLSVGQEFDALRELNLQRETNVHNLAALQYYFGRVMILMCLVGALGWLFFKHSLIVPSWFLSMNFMLPALAYYFVLFEDGVASSRILVSQEVFELLFALGLLMHAGVTYHRVNRFRPIRNSLATPQVGSLGAFLLWL